MELVPKSVTAYFLRFEHNLRDTLLRPLEVALHLLCSLHAVGKIPLSRRKPLTGKGLQLHQFARLGVELS